MPDRDDLPRTTETSSGHPYDGEPDQDFNPWSIGRILAGLFIVGSFAFWVYAFSGIPSRENPDRLDESAFAVEADGLCAAAKARIGELPSADSAPDVLARADVLDQANDEVETLIRQLRSIVSGSDSDVRNLGLWLDDWEVFAADRREHAERLRTEGDVRFVVSGKEGQHVTEWIDGFARVNDMDSCEVPLDV